MSFFWLSTTYASYTGNAWGVNLSSGIVANGDKSGSFNVRAVRGGQ
jgi:hypothetical protein